MLRAADGLVQLHHYYPYLREYCVTIVPESWDMAQHAISGVKGYFTNKHLVKVVYLDPCIADMAQYDPTADQLRAYGEKLADAEYGVDAQLYYINGDRWVILPDQTVINYDLIGETDYSQPITFNI